MRMNSTEDLRYDYLIVGAGLYGASLARTLTDRGYKVIVAEKKDHVGGAAFTKMEHGIMVHSCGAHIFHTSSERVWEFVRRFSEFTEYIHEPKAFYKGTLYSLPFNMNTFHEIWGISQPEEAGTIIAQQIKAAALGNREPQNLEEQAISLVGTDVYEILIKGYTEKQWGKPCTELPASIIKRIPVRYEYNNNYFDDHYQGIPKNGYTAMVEKMLDGIEVMTGTDFLDPVHREKLNGIAGRIVYSGQIDAYYDFCFGPLEYRGLRFETEYLSAEECKKNGFYQDAAVINYTDADVPWTRIIEHKHFAVGNKEGSPEGTMITREYSAKWCPGEDAFYPVADQQNLGRYKRYMKLAESDGKVVFGGRLGSYRYMDMDDVIAAALEDADKLCKPEGN